MPLSWIFALRFLTNRNSTSVIKRVGWISMFSIVLSVLSLVFVLGIMKGLNQRTFERTLAAESHLSVFTTKESSLDLSQLSEELIAIAKELGTPIKSIFVQDKQDVLLRTLEGKFQPAVAIGLSREDLTNYFQRISETNVRQRSAQTWLPRMPGEDENLNQYFWFGYDLAMTLGVFEGEIVLLTLPETFLAPIGSPINLERIRVGQIYSSNLFETDSSRIFYIRELSPISKSAQGANSLIKSLEIWLEDAGKLPKFEKELKERFSGQIQITGWRERNSALILALELERGMIGFFLGLASLVAGLSILSLIGIILTQKRRDLALMRVLGYSPQKLRRFIIGVGMLYTNSAIFMGVLIGGILTLYFSVYPLILMPEIYYDADLPVVFDLKLCMAVLILGLLGSWLGTLWVTRGLGKTQITAALKEKMT